MSRLVSRVMWVFIVLGAIFLFEGASSAINSQKVPVDFNSLKETDFQENMIVEGYVEYNLGCFEEEYRTVYGIKTGDTIYNYLIPISETRYMGLKNQTETQRVTLDQQTNDTVDALTGRSVAPTPFYFKGRIKKMTTQEIGFMKDYITSMGYTEAQAQNYMCHYYIECVDFSGGMTKVGIGLLLLVVGLGVLIVPTVQEARIAKRKETMLNNVSSQSSSVNRYNESSVKDPFAPEPLYFEDKIIEDNTSEEIWNPAPTSSDTVFDMEKETAATDSTSSTGLKLKM